MIINYLFLSTVIASALSLMPARALCSESIRVAIAENQRSIVLASPSGFVVEGRDVLQGELTMTVGAALVGSKPLRVRSAGDFIGVNKKKLPGMGGVAEKKERPSPGGQ